MKPQLTVNRVTRQQANTLVHLLQSNNIDKHRRIIDEFCNQLRQLQLCDVNVLCDVVSKYSSAPVKDLIKILSEAFNLNLKKRKQQSQHKTQNSIHETIQLLSSGSLSVSQTRCSAQSTQINKSSIVNKEKTSPFSLRGQYSTAELIAMQISKMALGSKMQVCQKQYYNVYLKYWQSILQNILKQYKMKPVKRFVKDKVTENSDYLQQQEQIAQEKLLKIQNLRTKKENLIKEMTEKGIPVVMDNGSIEVVAILDMSGSMSNLTSDTINGFNSYLAELSQQDCPVFVTLVLFNTIVKTIYSHVNAKLCSQLSTDIYIPDNCTALLDAIGTSITNINIPSQPKLRPHKVTFFICTDGLENASTHFSKSKIKQLITERSDWEFIFAGANMDAFAAGEELGFKTENIANIDNDSLGQKTVFQVMAKKQMKKKCCNYEDETVQKMYEKQALMNKK
ncbi:von_Willebrand factor type A domain-containing protein [Hexamita inflata]|uniref:von Willebrand factor type A domain-containing protein n=1 Tax=Hexamita inflata TaxID=28002 RepID=A0AA86P0K4_9EUKA|nr:von Willebrand factor type A domain-containing protein [Hexamita inflata]